MRSNFCQDIPDSITDVAGYISMVAPSHELDCQGGEGWNGGYTAKRLTMVAMMLIYDLNIFGCFILVRLCFDVGAHRVQPRF